eukprot:Nk52_evm1s2310 gene=Nk52_evmTU1s2310
MLKSSLIFVFLLLVIAPAHGTSDPEADSKEYVTSTCAAPPYEVNITSPFGPKTRRDASFIFSEIVPKGIYSAFTGGIYAALKFVPGLSTFVSTSNETEAQMIANKMGSYLLDVPKGTGEKNRKVCKNAELLKTIKAVDEKSIKAVDKKSSDDVEFENLVNKIYPPIKQIMEAVGDLSSVVVQINTYVCITVQVILSETRSLTEDQIDTIVGIINIAEGINGDMSIPAMLKLVQEQLDGTKLWANILAVNEEAIQVVDNTVSSSISVLLMKLKSMLSGLVLVFLMLFIFAGLLPLIVRCVYRKTLRW